MTKVRNRSRQRWLTAVGLTLAACGSDSAAEESGFESYENGQAIIEAYADVVVVSTYELLAERIGALAANCATLRDAPSDDALAAARAAWIDARKPWEQSEGFLFGPVDANGFDPALDSWPVNRTDLDAVLASGDELSPAYIAALDPTLRGFHTAEYLLFGKGGTKTAAAFTPRELQYAAATTSNMAAVAGELAKSWSTGLGGAPAYATVFKSAGASDNTLYPSRKSAVEEMVRGMIGIADEVANGKIADPFEQHDAKLVESQFSYNSLADFQDNIRSIQNAYTGDNPEAGKTGAGLDEFVQSRDPELDARVKQEIDASISGLAQIPPPFRDAILDPAAEDELENAQQAIRTLQTTLERDVLALVLE